jgi:hypothetical protein
MISEMTKRILQENKSCIYAKTYHVYDMKVLVIHCKRKIIREKNIDLQLEHGAYNYKRKHIRKRVYKITETQKHITSYENLLFQFR